MFSFPYNVQDLNGLDVFKIKTYIGLWLIFNENTLCGSRKNFPPEDEMGVLF